MDARDSVDDRAYFVRRSREERLVAERCANSDVAVVHRQLAEEYDRRAGVMPVPSEATA